MLADPNDESPANIDAAKMWRENRKKRHNFALDLWILILKQLVISIVTKRFIGIF